MNIQKIEKNYLDQATMKHSILIVEDEKRVRECMAKALSDIYKTYQAANGREAMEIINMKNNIRVVVSDLNMPEVSGLELLEQIRYEKKYMPFIFVTAHTLPESKFYAAQLGAFDYLDKPLDLDKLESVLQRAIENESISHGKPLNKGVVS
jgi:DNA-binding NtrC family response regulator